MTGFTPSTCLSFTLWASWDLLLAILAGFMIFTRLTFFYDNRPARLRSGYTRQSLSAEGLEVDHLKKKTMCPEMQTMTQSQGLQSVLWTVIHQREWDGTCLRETTPDLAKCRGCLLIGVPSERWMHAIGVRRYVLMEPFFWIKTTSLSRCFEPQKPQS